MPFKVVKIDDNDEGKYRVINSDTGEVHAFHTTKKKAQEQVEILQKATEEKKEPAKPSRGRPKKYATAEEARLKRIEKTKESNARMKLKKQQQGKGIMDNITNTFNSAKNAVSNGVSDIQDKVSTFANKVINPSQAYPPCLTQIKNELGDEKITGLVLRRNPVSSLITGAMNAVSLGSFAKKMGRQSYDKLFHLSMLVETGKGKFVLEKIERVNATKTISNPEGLETLAVCNIPSSLSVNELIDNTQKKMGNNFLPYNANGNNCQNFILNVLQANNLNTPAYEKFVKQDTAALFANDPFLAKVSKKLTDVGASLNVVQHGGELKSHDNYMSEFSYLLPQAEQQVRSMLGMGIHHHHHHWHLQKGGDIFGDIAGAFSPHGAIAKAFTPDNLKKVGKTVSHYALPAVGSAIGGAAGTALTENPIGGVIGASLGGMAGKRADEAVQGTGLRRRRRKKAAMEGEGWLSGLLDKPFTARQAIQGAKKLPDLAKSAVDDIKGAGLKRKFAKGSQEAKDFMAKLRSMRKKK